MVFLAFADISYFLCCVIVQLLIFKDNIQLMPENYLFPLQIGIMLAIHFPAFRDKTHVGMTNIFCRLSDEQPAYIFSFMYLWPTYYTF